MRIADLIGGVTRARCPRCGGKMKQTRMRSARIDRCRKNCGVWIDQHQLDQLAGQRARRYEVTQDLPAQLLDRKPSL